MSFEPSQTLAGTANPFAGLAGRQPRLPEWLPAPPARALPKAKPTNGHALKRISAASGRALSATRPRAAGSATSAESLWIPLPAEPITEKLLMVLLALTTIFAIGNGFASMLELVQNWAGFNLLVSQLIN